MTIFLSILLACSSPSSPPRSKALATSPAPSPSTTTPPETSSWTTFSPQTVDTAASRATASTADTGPVLVGETSGPAFDRVSAALASTTDGMACNTGRVIRWNADHTIDVLVMAYDPVYQVPVVEGPVAWPPRSGTVQVVVREGSCLYYSCTDALGLGCVTEVDHEWIGHAGFASMHGEIDVAWGTVDVTLVDYESDGWGASYPATDAEGPLTLSFEMPETPWYVD